MNKLLFPAITGFILFLAWGNWQRSGNDSVVERIAQQHRGQVVMYSTSSPLYSSLCGH